MLFRSEQLVSVTESDIAVLKGRGIGAIVDFRSEVEQAETPDPRIEGVQNISIPVIQDVRAGITRDKKSKLAIIKMLARGGDDLDEFVTSYMRDMYRAFIADEFSARQYGRFVDEVIACGERGRAVLWHCSGGKDRAGFATAVVLGALGASWDDIVADYLKTNENLPAVEGQLKASVGKLLPMGGKRDAVRKFFLADRSYMEVARETAEERYGSFDGYLEKGLGIDAVKKARMRELFVEATPS